MSDELRTEQWITRREAARILGTSPENVKQLQRRKNLQQQVDAEGRVLLRRSEIEALAMQRASQQPSTALTALVYGMIRGGMDRATICDNLLEEINDLIDGYYERAPALRWIHREELERQRQREHEEQIREMDRELDRRRRLAHGDDPNALPR